MEQIELEIEQTSRGSFNQLSIHEFRKYMNQFASARRFFVDF